MFCLYIVIMNAVLFTFIKKTTSGSLKGWCWTMSFHCFLIPASFNILLRVPFGTSFEGCLPTGMK